MCLNASAPTQIESKIVDSVGLKTNFCEESHQQSQYLLLCCKEVEYDSKYDISSLSAPSVQICLLLLQKDLGSLTY